MNAPNRQDAKKSRIRICLLGVLATWRSSSSIPAYDVWLMKRKLYLETFGCQMNVLDSELVLGQFRAHGYEQVDERDQADVIIYNTCSVREHAEQKVWSRLGELRDRKKNEPHLV